MELIDKATVKAEIERRKNQFVSQAEAFRKIGMEDKESYYAALASNMNSLSCFLDTLEVKEVDITSMADDYYDALIKEAEMDVDMAGHCRLAYYNGCKDVLNKIQKGE